MSNILNQIINSLSIIAIISIVSCQEKEVSYTLKEEMIIEILVDIHITEAAAQQGNISQRDSLRALYYNQIFEIHGVSKKTYEEDMELLKKDAEKITKVYDKVIEKLKERKADL